MNRIEALKRLHDELGEWPKPSTLRAEVPEIPGWRWDVRAASATLERRDPSGFTEVITKTDWAANHYHFKRHEADATDNALIRHGSATTKRRCAAPGCDRPAPNGGRCDGHDVREIHDAVNQPSHYQSDDGIECIDAIRAALGRDGFIAHCRGTAIKYAWRSGKKAAHAEDLRKACVYLEWAAKALEEGE